MKERKVLPEEVGVTWDYLFKIFRLLFIFFLLLSVVTIKAQEIPVRQRFNPGEEVQYELYFKLGFLMPRAGIATLSIQNTSFENQSAYLYRLLFQTSGIIERIYKMRDTIDCHFSPKMLLLQSEKRVNENDYYLIDNLRFSYDKNQIKAHSHRYTLTQTKIDTLLVANEPYMFDMLGATLYLRSLDWTLMKNGDRYPFQVAIGKDVVNISFRYTGQQIVERNNELKYRTHHFYIDIYDEAFTQSKAAAEVWISDDENHLPIKIRAKLKIGAAEVHYKTSKGLRHSFSSKVEIK